MCLCWAALPGLWALCLPGFKTKERAWSQRQKHQWSSGWGAYLFKARSGATPHRVQLMEGLIWWLHSQRAGKGYQLWRNWSSCWPISYQGNQEKGTPLTTPLISWWRCFDHSLGQGQVCRMLYGMSRVLVKQALIKQRYTESKKTAILIGLIITALYWGRGRRVFIAFLKRCLAKSPWGPILCWSHIYDGIFLW